MDGEQFVRNTLSLVSESDEEDGSGDGVVWVSMTNRAGALGYGLAVDALAQAQAGAESQREGESERDSGS